MLYHIKDQFNDYLNKLRQLSTQEKSAFSDLSKSITHRSHLFKNFQSERKFDTLDSAKEYLKWSMWDCEKLTKVKIEIFNNISFNILQLNKSQVSKDQKKLFDQEQRTKF